MRKTNKILLLGSVYRNTGPSNVNRNLVLADDSIWYQKSRNRFVRILETAIKFALADTIVFSAYVRMPMVRLAKRLKKKTVYIMHGYIKYENMVNGLNLPESELIEEDQVIHGVDLILCVSETYKKWFQQQCPDIKNVHFLHNGIDLPTIISHDVTERLQNSIAVAGGNRSIKNNEVVCAAAEQLESFGVINPSVYVYGRNEKNINKPFAEFPHTVYKGLLPNTQFLEELKKIQLFVINSTVESFALVAGEALASGCSLLISETVGFADLLDLTEADVIHDTQDSNEIAEKIAYLLQNPNHERLAASVEFEHYSKANAAARLHRICDALLAGENYESIR